MGKYIHFGSSKSASWHAWIKKTLCWTLMPDYTWMKALLPKINIPYVSCSVCDRNSNLKVNLEKSPVKNKNAFWILNIWTISTTTRKWGWNDGRVNRINNVCKLPPYTTHSVGIPYIHSRTIQQKVWKNNSI